jgi:hypothetical protein
VLDRDSEGQICSGEASCEVEVILGVGSVAADSAVLSGCLAGRTGVVGDNLLSTRIGQDRFGAPSESTLDGILELVYSMDKAVLVFIPVVQFIWACPKVFLFSLYGKQS